eukprot:scpid45263/ scgid32765/ G protein-activated inward rectifier potassium channel 2; Inward rectifier K(+) channel Kir3.2; Potassium channel, inwardly rectifying subfamily J member 6
MDGEAWGDDAGLSGQIQNGSDERERCLPGGHGHQMSMVSSHGTTADRVQHSRQHCHTPFRIVGANGERLAERLLPLSHRLYYIRDFFITLVVCKWRYTLLALAGLYCASWILFAGLWYALNTHDESCFHLSNSTYSDSFNTMFIFSIAVQTTIGFGNDFIQDSCQLGSFLLAVQCVIGLMLDGLLLGLILTKASRAKSRARTVLFSTHGGICRRDGQLCLLWRVADLRTRSMCEAHLRAYCYRSQTTLEGEQLDWECRELDLGYDTGRDRILLLLPVTVCHFINDASPLRHLTEEELSRSRFEIVLLLEGVIEATGLTAQAMHSYTNRDILWGYRFKPMVSTTTSGRIAVDYSELNAMQKVDIELPGM